MAPPGKNHSFPVEPLQEIIRLPQYRFQHKGQEGTSRQGRRFIDRHDRAGIGEDFAAKEVGRRGVTAPAIYHCLSTPEFQLSQDYHIM